MCAIAAYKAITYIVHTVGNKILFSISYGIWDFIYFKLAYLKGY